MSRTPSRRALMSPALVVPAMAALCLGGALAGSMGGCVQILGNDFVVVGDGGGGAGGDGQGGSGAAGGAGGARQGGGGGQGGGGLGNYDCDWGLNQHLELARLEGTNQFITGDLLAERRDDQSARLLVARAGGSTQDEGVVFTVNGGGNVNEASFPASRVHQLERTSVQAMGALYNVTMGNQLELRLRQVGDSGSGDDDLVANNSSNAFPGLNGSSLNARFAVVSSSIGNPVIDILAWWPLGDGTYRMGYARYSGTPVTFQPVTTFADNNDAEVTAMVHHNGTTYGWLGSDSALGTRLVSINAQTSFPLTPQPVGLIDTFLFTYGSSAEETRFMALRNTQPLQFMAGAIDNESLSTFDPTTDLNVAGTWDDPEQVPVLFGTHRWHGRISTFIGTPFSQNMQQTDLRYWLIDSDGNERGFKVMPFTANLPAMETRMGPLAGTSVPVGTDFDTAAGPLHVFWIEYHASPVDGSFPVLYYDRLVCAFE